MDASRDRDAGEDDDDLRESLDGRVEDSMGWNSGAMVGGSDIGAFRKLVFASERIAGLLKVFAVSDLTGCEEDDDTASTGLSGRIESLHAPHVEHFHFLDLLISAHRPRHLAMPTLLPLHTCESTHNPANLFLSSFEQSSAPTADSASPFCIQNDRKPNNAVRIPHAGCQEPV